MTSLINKNITPIIFEHGGVGASRGFSQLAICPKFLLGRVQFFYEGERRPTEEVFYLK